MSAKIETLVIKGQPSIRQTVFDHLHDDILSGRIRGGQRLVEARIAKEIGVSRTPVREALHMLENEGLLESIPRVGYRVKEMSWDDVEEIVAIRTVNEILAAKWAIERITPAETAALERNLEQAQGEIEAGRPESFVEYGAEFHDLVIQASGSSRLIELCHSLRRHMHRYRVESFHEAEISWRALAGHRRILDCIKAKDAAMLEQVMREHLEQSKADIKLFALEPTEA